MSSTNNNASTPPNNSSTSAPTTGVDTWHWCGTHLHECLCKECGGDKDEALTTWNPTYKKSTDKSNDIKDKTADTKPTDSTTPAETKATQDTKDTKDIIRFGPCGNPLTIFSTEDPCLRSDKCTDGKELDEDAKKTSEQLKAKGTRVSIVNGIFH
jgi:hypothetical protein